MFLIGASCVEIKTKSETNIKCWQSQWELLWWVLFHNCLLTTSGAVNCLKLVIIFLSQLDTVVIYMMKQLGGKLLFKKGEC
jgi:hypothetical protein